MPSKDWYATMAQRIADAREATPLLRSILTDLLLALRQVEAEAIISRHPDRTRSAVLKFQDRQER